MSDICIRDLGVRLGPVDIIRGLNLDLQSGEFLVLLGPSGCGKSTLLHSIAGFIEPQTGSIAIAGRDVTWADPKDRGIGMVFQSYALYPTMTVERNLSFGPRIAGVPKAQISERVQGVAAMLQLTDLLQRKPANLSGGQRQRVAIGRALVRQAQVLLFDEPLSNLDAQLRASLRRELKELHAKLGATMVYVTHDQIEAMTLATRIAVMRGGAIQQIDTPALVYGRPANQYVAGFLGSPAMNFVQGKLQIEGGACWFVHAAGRVDVSAYPYASAPETGQTVVLGVRPEDITLNAEARPDAWPARVSLVEPMGAHQVLWIQADGLALGAIADAALDAPTGTLLHATFDRTRVSLFDLADQTRL